MRKSRRDTRMYGPNRFKLGLFAHNCSGGLTMTKAPEHWDASWDNNVEAARLADRAGVEFLLPVSRWLGYGGETDTEGTSFETLTWATGLLAVTEDISIFGTVHVALINPVFAAKQMVTADHVGRGRFGLNIVSGWNVDEHAMFGIGIRDHDERYAYSREWLTIVRRLWEGGEPFDFDGRFFALKGVKGSPGPYFGDRPALISAGNSPVGRAFAVEQADFVFMGIRDLDALADEIGRSRRGAAKDIGFFGCGNLICRRTSKEADEYYRYLVHEHGDWEGGTGALTMRARGRTQSSKEASQTAERMVAGTGTLPIVGSYDEVVETFARMSEAGLDGIAIGLVDYVAELPMLRDEVMPRMQRLGLRERDASQAVGSW